MKSTSSAVVAFDALHRAPHVQQYHIGDDQGGHRLADDGAAHGDAGIVAPFEGEIDLFASRRDGLLRAEDGRRRFEVDVERDGVAVADAAQDATAAVGGETLRADGIVVLGTIRFITPL